MVKYREAVLDSTFAALAHPTRRAILARLACGESRVSELAEPFNMSLPAVSKHLRMLERAGLLAQEKDGRVRRCQLVAEPLQDAAEWIAGYRGFWESQFDALALYLNNEEATWLKPNKKSRSASSASSRPRAKKSSRRGPTRKS